MAIYYCWRSGGNGWVEKEDKVDPISQASWTQEFLKFVQLELFQWKFLRNVTWGDIAWFVDKIQYLKYNPPAILNWIACLTANKIDQNFRYTLIKNRKRDYPLASTISRSVSYDTLLIGLRSFFLMCWFFHVTENETQQASLIWRFFLFILQTSNVDIIRWSKYR